MRFQLSVLTLTLLVINSVSAAKLQHKTATKTKLPITSSVSHPGGLEFGAEFGVNRMNGSYFTGANNSATRANRVYDYTNFQWGGHIGYLLPMTSHLLVGIETGYQNLGRTKGSTNTANDNNPNGDNTFTNKVTNMQDVNLLFDLRYYLNSSLAIEGKVGGGLKWYRSRSMTIGVNPVFSPTNYSANSKSYYLEPVWALGFLYNTSPHTNLSVMINHVGGVDSGVGIFSSNPSVTAVLAGMNWDLNNLEYLALHNNSDHPNGLEIGASVGYNTIQNGQGTEANSISATNRSKYSDYANVDYGAHVGYYVPVLPKLLTGIEVGYTNYGGTRFTNFSTTANAAQYYNLASSQMVSMLVAARYYILDRLALLGKVGGGFNWLKITSVTNGSAPTTGSTGGSDFNQIQRVFNPQWQLGFLVDLTNHLNTSLVFNEVAGKPTGASFFDIRDNKIMGVQGSLNWDTSGQLIPVAVGDHPGGWEIGGNIGYNRILTGQGGNAVSDTRPQNDDTIKYFDYGNLQGGGHLSYNYPVFSRLLVGVQSGYQYLGNTKWRNDRKTGNTPGSENYNGYNYQAVDLLATLRLYVLKNIALIGGLGGAYEWFTVTHTVNSGTGPYSGFTAPNKSEQHRYFINPEWQVGALVDLNFHLNVTLAYQRFVGQTPSNAVALITNPNIGGFIGGINWDLSQQAMPTETRVHAGGFNFGVSSGYNRVNTGDFGSQGGILNGPPSGYRLYDYWNIPVATHAGYDIALNKRFLIGIDTGYQYLGGSKLLMTSNAGGEARAKTHGIQTIDALAAMKFYVTNNTAFTAKVGAAFKWYQVTVATGAIAPISDLSANQTYSSNGFFINPEWQLGMQFDVSQHMAFTTYVEQIVGQPGAVDASLAPASNANPTIMSAMVGIDFHNFG